jgi:chorismate mutase/prephenate dehydratase
VYGLKKVAGPIEDRSDNTTRFLVLGRESFPPSGHDRTSLLVFIRDRPGALYGVLEPLARRGISMNRIESRPAHGHLWQYAFFIDVAGHRDESPLQRRAGRDRPSRATKCACSAPIPVAIL